jgi:O-antigen ligase
MNKNISYLFKDRFKVFFWGIILLILPFIFSTRLIDEDNFPKLLFIAIIMSVLCVRSFIRIEFRNFDLTVVTIVIINILFFIFSFTQSDIYSTGITALMVIIFPMILFLILNSNRLQSELIYCFIPVAGILLCVIAITQFFLMHGKNFQPVHLIRATMSNKNFLSESLIMYLIFCIAGFINMEGSVRKMNMVAAFIILFTILLLQTLSAYICIVFLVGIAIIALIFFKLKHQSRKKIYAYVFAVLILLTIGGLLISKLALFNGVKIKLDYALKLITGSPLPEVKGGLQNSIYERLYLWKNSWKLFSESPLTGIGLADWQIYWPKYGMSGASYLDAAIMRYEHPHNEFILLLTECGVAGLVCYLSFFLFFIYRALRIIFSKSEIRKRLTALLMLSGIICLLILCFFGYPLHRPYTIILVILMCVVIHDLSGSGGKKKIRGRVLPGLFLIFSLCSIIVFANRISGEYNFSKALVFQSHANFSGMLRSVRSAENTFYTTDNSSTPLDWYKGFAMFYQGNDSALYYYKRSEEQNPFHVQTLSDIGALLENQGKHEEAIPYFRRVLSYVPNYYEAHFNLAVAYFNVGKATDALNEINSCFAIGDQYMNTRDVILAKNAELALDSCKKSDAKSEFLSDKKFLRKLNQQAIDSKISFRQLVCDSVFSHYNHLP